MAYAIRDFDDDRRAAHEQTALALISAHARLRDQVIPAVTSAIASLANSPWLFPWRGTIAAKAQQVRADLTSAEGLIATLASPVHLPNWLWRNAEEWTHVRAAVSAVAGDLSVTNREVHIRWQGAAVAAYHTVLPAHTAAATQLSSVADAVQSALSWAGTAAAVFYAGLVAIMLQAIAGLLVAVAAMVASPAGIAGLVAAVLIASALVAELAALIIVSTEAFGRAKVWMIEVLSEMRDSSVFPKGHWPRSRTEWYDDATVTDRDADWSVVP